MQKQYAIIVDILLVAIFALVGRASHSESLTPRGVLATAWPFLVALLVAWAVMLIRKREHLGVGAGIYVWLITWVGGLALRVISGDTAAVAFIVVAGLVLGLFLVGWRLINCAVSSSRRPAHPDAH